MNRKTLFLVSSLLLLSIGCSQPTTPPQPVTELQRFPLDSLDGVLTQSSVAIDPAISSDGQASLKITATEPTTVRLFETGDVNIENVRLIYQAKLRTEGVQGQVYLEMWCHFPGKGEFFPEGWRPR